MNPYTHFPCWLSGELYSKLEAWTELYLAAKSHTASPFDCLNSAPASVHFLWERHAAHFAQRWQILTSSPGHQGMHDSALLFSARLEGTCSQWGAVCFTQTLSIVITWYWRNKDFDKTNQQNEKTDYESVNKYTPMVPIKVLEGWLKMYSVLPWASVHTHLPNR